jgi:hypothetical protein
VSKVVVSVFTDGALVDWEQRKKIPYMFSLSLSLQAFSFICRFSFFDESYESRSFTGGGVLLHKRGEQKRE